MGSFLKIKLPVPPSTNMAYANRKGGRYLTSVAKTWKENAHYLVKNAIRDYLWTLRLNTVEVEIHANIDRRRDLDNILKLLNDSLEKGGVIKNDNLIDSLIVRRSDNFGQDKIGKDWCIVVIRDCMF